MKLRLLALLLSVFFAAFTVLAQDAEMDAVVTRDAAPSAESVKLTAVASGFFRPLYLTHAGDGSDRLFILEQTGKIWIVKDGARSEFPFLDLSQLITSSADRAYSEQGLLGMAFHPEYTSNGYFYLNYTDRQGRTVVARYQVSLSNPDIADGASGRIIFQLAQPYINHNGGHIDFGPDGYLYISLGDGGSANDPLGAGQNRQILLGSLLRIDVDSVRPYAIPPDNPFVGDPAALDEIWAYGLRNVWRMSFDRATGDLYMGDVGQNRWEEINFQPAASAGGENYGWNVWEGTHPFAGGIAPNHAPPIFEYSHAQGLGCSVTGGYVYRGEAIPALEAAYLFGDYCSGQVWATYRDHNFNWNTNRFMNTGLEISSFGEDERGELYIIDYGGAVFRLDPAGRE